MIITILQYMGIITLSIIAIKVGMYIGGTIVSHATTTPPGYPYHNTPYATPIHEGTHTIVLPDTYYTTHHPLTHHN